MVASALDEVDPNAVMGTLHLYVEEYRRSMVTYGIMSGVYFIVLSVALLLMFWNIFRLINNSNKLSESLQTQKGGLKLMMGIVILSYVLAGLINLFYGQYYKFGFSMFFKGVVYPITAIIVELPNIMVMYAIHWQTYKPITVADIQNSSVEANRFEVVEPLMSQSGDTDHLTERGSCSTSDMN